MQISIPDFINAFMIAVGIGITSLSIIQIRKAPIEKKVRGFFMAFLNITVLYISLHLARQFMSGVEGTGMLIGLHIVTILEFWCTAAMSMMLSQMILYIAHPQTGMKLMNNVLTVLLLIHTALLIVNAFTGFLYYFDATNTYTRGTLFVLSYLAPVLMLLQDVFLLIRYRQKFEKHVAIAFWIYIIAPLIALIFQGIFKDIQFLIFATVGAAVNMFMVITRDLTIRFAKQQIESSRIDTELSMATQIQESMLPNIFPAFPDRKDLDIYASMKPAKEVGGDFYDFFFIEKDLLGMVIADVSGKGVPAALFMMASKILVQNLALVKKDPKVALETTNEQICKNNQGMFVTMWLGIMDLKTGVLTASNAGHEYPIIKQPNGKFEMFKDKHGLVVGAFPETSYTSYQIKLEKGGMLFLYTDGVAEATNGNDEQFGLNRIVDTLNNSKIDNPTEALQVVDKAVGEFVGDAPQFDDLTMLCFKYNGK